MGWNLGGDRGHLPQIERQSPTLLPPSPYSIAPLGMDVHPPGEVAVEKRRVAMRAFVAGILLGAVVVGGTKTAWFLHRLHIADVAARTAAIQAAAAPPPAPVCPPVPAVTPPAPATPATTTAAAGAATPADDGSASTAKAGRTLHASHAKAKSHGRAPSLPSIPASKPITDDALMRAIGASAH
jgi:hypothetical protein